MEPAILGLVLDSSVLIAAERAKLTTPEAVKNVRTSIGDVPIVISALSVAEMAHGILSRRLTRQEPAAPAVPG